MRYSTILLSLVAAIAACEPFNVDAPIDTTEPSECSNTCEVTPRWTSSGCSTEAVAVPFADPVADGVVVYLDSQPLTADQWHSPWPHAIVIDVCLPLQAHNYLVSTSTGCRACVVDCNAAQGCASDGQ